ncbi:PREDICTED: cysteine-rich repeat secretory protein 4-like [Tarenaya hassleriana]|uniref:cysteine-rich repeat secretory protein 4-like n=1 Tax=Tarenaya hassleriana TaxID=28532 RepID=UPI00053C1897|nr:PREDICTED: cysteine-rich repeat secretory protein 4-like [Tarenaya hassleriana]
MARMVVIKISSSFCFITMFSLVFTTNTTMSQPKYMFTFCNQLRDNFTSTALYESNRDTVLSNLRLRSSLASYSNATSGLNPNMVRGMFLCRGDISQTTCQDCVTTANLQIVRNCTSSDDEEAFIFYEECMVRYSDWSFFSVNEDRPYILRYAVTSAPDTVSFGLRLSEKMNELIGKVSNGSPTPYFVKDRERVIGFEGSYYMDSIVQCSPDLDQMNCTVCLRLAFQEMSGYCSQCQWAQIFTPKCLLRFETTSLGSPSIGSGSFNMKGKGIRGIVVPAVASLFVILIL